MTLIERAFRERIVLVGMAAPPVTPDEAEAHLDELALLVDTAGADVVDRVVQRRDAPDPATYVGRGKAGELRHLSVSVDADTVVFDDELTPAQSRNLEKILGRTAIDRNYPVPGFETCNSGACLGNDVADHIGAWRSEQRKECREDQDREKEVGGRPCEDDKKPLPHRPNLESTVTQLRGNRLEIRGIARGRHVADELYVAAKRQPGDLPPGPLPIRPANQLMTETDRKGLCRDAEQPRH